MVLLLPHTKPYYVRYIIDMIIIIVELVVLVVVVVSLQFVVSVET